MKTKEKASILEQIISKLEKEQKQERRFKKFERFIFIFLPLAWILYFCSLIPSSGSEKVEYNLWLQSPFQILLLSSAFIFFVAYLRTKIIIWRKKIFIPSTIILQRYLKEGIPEIFLKKEGEVSRDTLEYFKMGVIMELLSMYGHDMQLFRQQLVQEISLLNQEGRKKAIEKLYELEGFFTYL